MSNISNQLYAIYERLASSKLNALVNQLNSHNHGSSGGVTIDTASAIPNGSITAVMLQSGSITGSLLANNSVTTSHIVDGTILSGDLNSSSIHLSVDGYAVYSA